MQNINWCMEISFHNWCNLTSWQGQENEVSKDLNAIWEIFCMKKVVTIIPENLITNLIVFFYYPFVETKNKN